MNWEVEYTDEFGDWWSTLSEAEQEALAASVRLLEARGPALGFPHSSGIKGSKYSHMRELRTQLGGRHVAYPVRIRPATHRYFADWRRQDRG